MNGARSRFPEDALAWAVRTADPDFTEWEAFAAWLDADPDRNRAYNDAMIAVAEAAAAVMVDARAPATVTPIGAAAPRPRRWWVVAGGAALAAGLAALLIGGRTTPPPPARVIEAAAGPPLAIELPDGSRATLAAGGRIRLEPALPRTAFLDRGRAVFDVRHDDRTPFSVVAGRHRIVDVGTVFEVAQADGATMVAVAEGRVMVDPSRAGLALARGDRVQLRAGAAAAVGHVPPDAIGRWRYPRMSYRDAPLPRVAADLSAALGRPIAVRGGVAAQRFTGTLVPATLHDRPAQLAALLGVRVHDDGHGWIIGAP